jgi:hypothetical protein
MHVGSPFLTSAPDGGERSASRPSRFTSRERTPCTHWIEDWVGSRAGLEESGENFLAPNENRTPAVQPVVATPC